MSLKNKLIFTIFVYRTAAIQSKKLSLLVNFGLVCAMAIRSVYSFDVINN